MPGSLRRPDVAPIYGGNLDSQNDFVLGHLASKRKLPWREADKGLVSFVHSFPSLVLMGASSMHAELKSHYTWGWRHGLEVKRTAWLFQGTRVLVPTPTWWLITVYNFRRSRTLFWPLWTPGPRVMHRRTCMEAKHPPTQINLKSFKNHCP